ncbi:MAG: GNAT family N-acetyltransferase [Verrucomicrobiales bacterium]
MGRLPIVETVISFFPVERRLVVTQATRMARQLRFCYTSIASVSKPVHQHCLDRITIRPALPADAPRLAELVRGLAALIVEDPAGAAPFWESVSQRAHEQNIVSERFRYYVAESDGTVVGFIAMRDATHLFNLFVESASQGHGIGRALWRHAAERIPTHARTRKVTVNASLNAVPIYQALGFKPAGVVVRQHGLAFVPMCCDRSDHAT